ncbi:MAG: HAMP domain-containing protein [Chloroflexi bacterium]|nr:HAMP domain-containing protein [Chloroflexota bacterium]
MFHSIRARIAVPYVVLTLITIAGLSAYTQSRFRATYLAQLEDRLAAEGAALAGAVVTQGPLSAEFLNPLAVTYGGFLDARVTFIGLDGAVLGDSHQDYRTMPSHLLRPEIQEALREGLGRSVRHSDTLDLRMLYVAVPVRAALSVAPDSAIAVVRVAVPISEVDAELARLRGVTLAAALVAVAVALVTAVVVANRTTKPIRQLERLAERFAAGDLGARLWPATQDEVARLTGAFNGMAAQLRQQMDTLAVEQGRMGAVLDHMADGALILDNEGNVSLANPAATRLLEIGRQSPIGRSFVQVARHHQLVDLWQQCRDWGGEQSATIEFGGKTFLQGIVTPLAPGQQRSGYLVILQDLTHIRRLETVRRDFISNISHELRTPLASLKALVETLRDGALDDPPAAERFLDLVETEVDTLAQMVQELLELSRIESGQVPLQLAAATAEALLLDPVERLRPQAERSGLHLECALPPGLPAVWADANRVQQVVTNLVHNAIKFTPPNGRVTCGAQQEGQAVVFWVKDTGVGISAKDLARVFERFYKADRARSGGGTGLGLAISRHIIDAHGGRIWAVSAEGKGSTFHFSLPVAPANPAMSG